MTESAPNGDDPKADGKSGGIFITKGMVVSLPPGGLTIRMSEDGRLFNDPLVLHVSQDVSALWIQIALGHLRVAEPLHPVTLAAKAVAEDQGLADALEAESVACMQAIVGAAIAVDAFYGMVKRHVDLPPDLVDTW